MGLDLFSSFSIGSKAFSSMKVVLLIAGGDGSLIYEHRP